MFAARYALKKSANLTSHQNLLVMQCRYFTVIKKYTKTHEWIELDTDTSMAKVGITDHAQSELGDIVHVGLPDAGTEFSKSEAISTVESVKTAADIYQMVDGEVVEVNDALNDEPELINKDSEGEGWIMKVKVKDQKQLNELLSADEYKDILWSQMTKQYLKLINT